MKQGYPGWFVWGVALFLSGLCIVAWGGHLAHNDLFALVVGMIFGGIIFAPFFAFFASLEAARGKGRVRHVDPDEVTLKRDRWQ